VGERLAAESTRSRRGETEIRRRASPTHSGARPRGSSPSRQRMGQKVREEKKRWGMPPPPTPPG
jgi:hypothetical protein